MQRSRKLSDFNDLEAFYHNRPCLWVEPKERLGQGRRHAGRNPGGQGNLRQHRRLLAPARTLCRRIGDQPQLPPHLGRRAGAADAAGDRHRRRCPHLWRAGPDHDHRLRRASACSRRRTGGPLTSTSTLPMWRPAKACCSAIRKPAACGSPSTFDPGDRDHVELRAQLRKDGSPASEVWLYRWTA